MSPWVTTIGIETVGLSLVSITGHGGVSNDIVFASTNSKLTVDLWSMEGCTKRTENAKNQRR